MVSDGDTAPTFTAPLANGDLGEFDLETAIDEEAPLVLAFFPGAFSGTCTNEMTAFQERLAAFEEAGGTVYGVSVDLPWSLNAFREKHGLAFDMISDTDKRLIEEWGLETDFASSGIYGIAKRAVFVVDGDGTLTYAWESPGPGIEPDYDEVIDAVRAAGQD